MTLSVSVGFSPFSAVVGIVVIGAGVAIGIGSAALVKTHGKKIADEAMKLWGKPKTKDDSDSASK
jgi:hypothetical protein